VQKPTQALFLCLMTVTSQTQNKSVSRRMVKLFYVKSLVILAAAVSEISCRKTDRQMQRQTNAVENPTPTTTINVGNVHSFQIKYKYNSAL